VISVPLFNYFFNPEIVYIPGELDKFLVGLATQPRQKYDNIVTDQVTNHLFQAENKSFGMDLIALNLQRGRDHGLPGYNAFRELCGLKRMKTFEGLSDLIPKQIVERLKLIYQDVDDIDLFIGGLSELSAPGAIVGPTFRCIIGDQFKRLQEGDRFFYDSADNPGKFTESQVAEIRHANLARITCDNGDDIHHMQPLAFRKPSVFNPVGPCDSITIPIVDLLPWQEGFKPEPLVRVSSLARLFDPSVLPPVNPYNYHHQPILTQTSPTPVFSQNYFHSFASSPVKAFIHSPLPKYDHNRIYRSL